VDHPCYHKRLFCDEESVSKFQLFRVDPIHPQKGAFFALEILDNIVFINTKVFSTDDFCIEEPRDRVGVIPFSLHFLSPRKNNRLIAFQGYDGARLLIIWLAFEDGEVEIEAEGVVRQFIFGVYDLVRDVFCVRNFAEGKTTLRGIHLFLKL
jgi:hypothetical protein